MAFLNRGRFFLLLGASAERWAKRHDIVPFSHPCYACGEVLTTTIPFAQGKKLRGLIAPACSCGNDRPPYAVVGFIA